MFNLAKDSFSSETEFFVEYFERCGCSEAVHAVDFEVTFHYGPECGGDTCCETKDFCAVGNYGVAVFSILTQEQADRGDGNHACSDTFLIEFLSHVAQE